MGERYQVVSDPDRFMVLDSAEGDRVVCECERIEDALEIASALNMTPYLG